VILAVNKMDLVGWRPEGFAQIVAEYTAFAGHIGLSGVSAVPVSAIGGDNLTAPSARSPWYDGPGLLELLESAEPARSPAARPFRMPVQWVSRPDADFRGFAGLIASGAVKPGEPVRAMPSGVETTVARIVTADGDLAEAEAGQSVTLVLGDEIDVSRGDVLAAADAAPEVAEQFEAALVWTAEEPLLPGREYLMKLGARQVRASVSSLRHRLDVDTLQPLAARTLGLNEIGLCNLSLDRPVAFEPYEVSRELGGFILIDPITDATAAAGMIRFALRRSHNIPWQQLSIDRSARAAAKRQRPRVLWFTGLSGAGKSTLANLLEKRLHAEGRHTYLLDGDNVRHGLNRDLGFTDADRVENIRRLAEVARLMADAGLIVLVSSISPFRAERRSARALFAPGEFVEVFVDAPLAVAEARDPKGLYRKARAGELRNFTGIDSPYEPPEAAEIRIDTALTSPDAAVELVLERLRALDDESASD
jgi:bifunctional enzyme CysN/CysC